MRTQHAILKQRFNPLRPFSSLGQVKLAASKEVDDLMDPEVIEQQTRELLSRID
jgi:hypothetical protein